MDIVTLPFTYFPNAPHRVKKPPQTPEGKSEKKRNLNGCFVILMYIQLFGYLCIFIPTATEMW